MVGVALIRVQYSVFECRLDASSLEKLNRRVKALIDPQEDRVRIYRLCLDCERHVEIQGAGHVVKDPDVYLL